MEYDDTTRATADFFSKNFPSNRLVKIGTETKSDNLTLKTTSQRSFVTDRKTKEVNEVYDTTIEPKYEFKDQGVTLELKLQTQNVQQVTLSKSDLVKGLKVSAGALQNLSKTKDVQQTANVGAEYKHEKVFFKVNAGIPIESKRAVPITGNLVIQPVDNIFVGTKFDLQYTSGEKGQLEKTVEFKLAGTSGATRGHLTATLDRKVGLFVNHTLENDVIGLQVAAQLPSDSLAIDLAASHKYCKSTLINGKLNITPALGTASHHGLRFGLGTTYTLRDGCTATLAGDLNVGQYIGQSGNPSSLGFELKLK
jgi:hypothetical protein